MSPTGRARLRPSRERNTDVLLGFEEKADGDVGVPGARC